MKRRLFLALPLLALFGGRPAGGGDILPRPDLRPGMVVRLSQTDPSGYRIVGEGQPGPGLLLTFPPIELAAIDGPAVRLAGRVPPGTELRINGAPAEIHPSGSFALLVDLSRGENTIVLSGRDGRGETVYPVSFRREAAGRVLPPARSEFNPPVSGRVAVLAAVIRSLPDGPRMLTVPGGTVLGLTGREGAQIQVDLGAGRSGWIFADSIEIGAPPAPGPARIGGGSFSAARAEAWFSLPAPVPARVEYHSAQELDLVFFNAIAASETIDLGDWEGICLPAPAENGTALFRLRGGMDCHRWSLDWVAGGCRLRWRGRPRPLEGPVCLDPGHGGDNRGAVSPGGIAEKDANLALARQVAAELEKAGLKAVLTREDDRTLGLEERIAIARRRGAGLFVSLHHNSVGPARDPQAVSGSTVYYYHPPARELAGAVHRSLRAAGLAGSGVRRRSLAVIRPTDLVAVLVEVAFLSHPDDEAKILDPACRRNTAAALAAGILEYLHR